MTTKRKLAYTLLIVSFVVLPIKVRQLIRATQNQVFAFTMPGSRHVKMMAGKYEIYRKITDDIELEKIPIAVSIEKPSEDGSTLENIPIAFVNSPQSDFPLKRLALFTLDNYSRYKVTTSWIGSEPQTKLTDTIQIIPSGWETSNYRPHMKLLMVRRFIKAGNKIEASDLMPELIRMHYKSPRDAINADGFKPGRIVKRALWPGDTLSAEDLEAPNL